MANEGNCPAANHYRRGKRCTENFAGVSAYFYYFLKEDLETEPVVSEDGTYAGYETLAFKDGKGVYRVDCKPQSNKITGESLGKNKGFRNTATFIIDAVSEETSRLMRAINNLELGFLVKDGEDFQILYSPDFPTDIAEGGISSDTGDAANSDRQTTVTVTCQPMLYKNMRCKGPITEYVEPPVTP